MNFSSIVVAVASAAYSSAALAYVGPGLGLGALGALIGGVLAVLLAILGLFWYPLKRMFKSKRGNQPANNEDRDKDGAKRE